MTLNSRLILLFVLIFNTVNAQQYKLNIVAKDSINTPIIYNVGYNALHSSEKDLKNEVLLFTKKLDSLGFLNNTYNITKNDTIYTYRYNLGVKIDSAIIAYTNTDLTIVDTSSNSITKTEFTIPFTEISNTLNKIVSYYEDLGFSFTQANLINISTNKNKLYATLNITTAKKRTIDKIIVNGYQNFPIKFLRNFWPNKHILFNRKKIKLLENELNSLDFITQIKPPEVLFKQDSTIVYIYIKKKQNNTADGILGFSNNESEKLILTGALNLHLENLFNKGGLYELNWNSVSNTNTIINIYTYNPYLFKTNVSLNSNFILFKKDDNFTNTSLNLAADYKLHKNFCLGVNYFTEQSNSINKTSNTTIDYVKNLIGFYLNATSNFLNFIHIIKLSGGAKFGKRKTSVNTNQNIYEISATYTYNINVKNKTFIKHQFKLLESENTLTNEQFRIGGSSSLRGFDEESIFASQYNLSSLEYHYTSTNNLTLFTLIDYANLKRLNFEENQYYLAFGIGSKIKTNSNSILTLIYALGKSNEQNFELRNSKLHIKFQLKL